MDPENEPSIFGAVLPELLATMELSMVAVDVELMKRPPPEPLVPWLVLEAPRVPLVPIEFPDRVECRRVSVLLEQKIPPPPPLSPPSPGEKNVAPSKPVPPSPVSFPLMVELTTLKVPPAT